MVFILDTSTSTVLAFEAEKDLVTDTLKELPEEEFTVKFG